MKADSSLGSPGATPEQEPSGLFPRTVRPIVFRWMWAVLVVLLVVLTALAVEYSRLSGS